MPGGAGPLLSQRADLPRDLLWDGSPWALPVGDVNGDGKTDLYSDSGAVVITEVCDLAP